MGVNLVIVLVQIGNKPFISPKAYLKSAKYSLLYFCGDSLHVVDIQHNISISY
ncbi:hypothetical protein JCM19538_404 [Jejuia pallidilutea]|uniref:Uncharacterized protein n=1 Tax=Jejuia pallidilutea TaxID=504487 RepID=A0A098LW61_9FLAO|nr:hypothetical protein JCM19538_404 [Jejuia pallidilutea]